MKILPVDVCVRLCVPVLLVFCVWAPYQQSAFVNSHMYTFIGNMVQKLYSCDCIFTCEGHQRSKLIELTTL